MCGRLDPDEVVTWLHPGKRVPKEVDDKDLLTAMRERYAAGDRPNVNTVAKDVQDALGARGQRDRIRELAKLKEFDSFKPKIGVSKRR